jgi:hypothetical protein
MVIKNRGRVGPAAVIVPMVVIPAFGYPSISVLTVSTLIDATVFFGTLSVTQKDSSVFKI